MQWDSEVQEQMKKIVKKKRMGLIFVLLGVICPFSLIAMNKVEAWWGFPVTLFIVLLTIGLLIGGGIVWFLAKGKMKDLIGTAYMPRALDKVFRNVKYEQNLHIPIDYIEQDLVSRRWEDIGGNDYVQGEYRDLPIEFSDLWLTYETQDTDSDGHTSTTTHTVFKGLWLVCFFETELPAGILLIRKKFKLFGNKPPNGTVAVATGNGEFEKEFRVFADDEMGAKSLLTPEAMANLLKLSKQTGGHSNLKIDRSGAVHVAVNSNKNFFEVGGKISAIEEKIAGELKYITDIIDALMGVIKR